MSDHFLFLERRMNIFPLTFSDDRLSTSADGCCFIIAAIVDSSALEPISRLLTQSSSSVANANELMGAADLLISAATTTESRPLAIGDSSPLPESGDISA